jgi:toxin secretion/phage lysis holin
VFWLKLDAVKVSFGVVGSGLSWLFGGWDTLIQYLLLFMAADYVTGIIKSGMKKEISSKIGFRGIGKKVGILVVVAMAQGLDVLLADQTANILGVDMPMIRTVVIWAYIVNELTSIIENVEGMGVPVPPVIDKVLSLVRQRSNK